MSSRRIFPLLGLLMAASAFTAGMALSQADKKLSAREIFYSAPVEPSPAPKAAPRQAAKTREQKPAESAQSKPATAAPSQSGAVPAATSNQIVAVSYTPAETVPLGIRYSILKREGSESIEVDADSVFRSGDRIRLRIEVNTAGYLYIVNRGSSGNWKPLFPSPEIADGDNRVQRGRSYEIPPGYVFTFDEEPGRENLFIVFSRQPELDLEGLIYSLTGGLKKPEETVRPLLAQANIEDSLIRRLRTVYSRDLIIEKGDETAPPAPSGPAKDKAMYVVNPSRAADARVVADVSLIHK